jgi:hypothetical protein
LFKFNSSLSDKHLKLAKVDHAQHCTKTFTSRSLDVWMQTYVMTDEQYDRFKLRRWKQTDVPYKLNSHGGKESVPERSWRQIRETIFPTTQTSEAIESSRPLTVGQVDDEIQNVINSTGRRPSDFRQRTITEFRSPAMDAPSQADLPPIPASLTTADTSWYSTEFSTMTDPQTWPSTLMDSNVRVDIQEDAYSCGDAYSYGFGEATEQGESSSRRAPDTLQGQPFSNSLRGAGYWDTRN